MECRGSEGAVQGSLQGAVGGSLQGCNRSPCPQHHMEELGISPKLTVLHYVMGFALYPLATAQHLSALHCMALHITRSETR